MNTSVASNSIPLSAKTRASSIDSTVPLPSSLAPGRVDVVVLVGPQPAGSAFGAAAARPAPAAPRQAGSCT
jgi:hypothetical protein